MSHKILTALNLDKDNYGASTGNDWWSTTTDLGRFNSINPAYNEIISRIYRPSAADYEHVVQTAQKNFLKWREYPAPKRAEIIRQIANALREKKSELGTLVSLESGKTLQEGLGEVQEMIDMADFAVGQARLLSGPILQSERPEHRMYEQWHPLGTVGVITAFNFPVAVWSWNAFIAAICGNTVIWKPSHKTTLCALAVQHICNQVLEENNWSGIFSLLVTDETSLAQQLVQDKRIALISFTGSSAVGLEIATRVAERMGRCLLECSGNNAVIIDESADLQLALQAILFGAIGTAGQRCTTIRRLIIHESIYDILINNLVKSYAQITIGDPLNEKNSMGPLIDQDAVNQFQKAITEIQKIGGEILFGGHVINTRGFYVEPTIVCANNDWPIVQQETFAPILYVMKYKNIRDAVEMNNQVPQGLSSAIFTNQLKNTEYFLSAHGSDCGLANVNLGTSGAEIGGAFGGEKWTGGGREAGSDAWKAYMRRQTVTINWSAQLPLAQGIQFLKETE